MALIAFAGNSVLCRLALVDDAIDPAGFSLIRLLSGILVLWPLLFISQGKAAYQKSGSWFSALMLFVYALLLSLIHI